MVLVAQSRAPIASRNQANLLLCARFVRETRAKGRPEAKIGTQRQTDRQTGGRASEKEVKREGKRQAEISQTHH